MSILPNVQPNAKDDKKKRQLDDISDDTVNSERVNVDDLDDMKAKAKR